MGLTRLRFTVSNAHDLARSAEIELLVDTGAMVSMVPGWVLERLGVPRLFRRDFRLGDGHIMQRDMGVAVFGWNDHASGAPVAFGEPGDESVLGATALEAMSLAADPARETLQHVDNLRM